MKKKVVEFPVPANATADSAIQDLEELPAGAMRMLGVLGPTEPPCEEDLKIAVMHGDEEQQGNLVLIPERREGT
jgi:hypothetical protein